MVVTGQETALRMQEQAELLMKQLLALYQGDDILGVEMAYAGASLQRYAQKWYGDSGAWPQLARYNGLSAPVLDPGTVVVIPRFDVLEAYR